MRRAMVLGLAALVSGCALPKPIVDLKAVDDPQAYQKDLIECVTLADYYLISEIETTRKIVKDTAMGGAGALISGSVMGSSSASLAAGMTAGVVGGAIGGAINASRDNEMDRNRGAEESNNIHS